MGLEAALVGSNNKRAALMGVPPEPAITNQEVLAYVKTLMANHRVDLDRTAKKSIVGDRGGESRTHRVKGQGPGATLERVRFACGCRPGAHALVPR